MIYTLTYPIKYDIILKIRKCNWRCGNKMSSICFTGHRNIKKSAELKQRIWNAIENSIKNGITDFYAGGAPGFDTICAQTVLQLRNSYPQIKLHLILPCSEEEQTAKWDSDQKSIYYDILGKADSIERLSENYYNGCMKVRNARLVELADCCICYYDVKKRASGTGQTVRMAQKKGIGIINLAE